MPTIEIPEVGSIDFPDSMSEQQITAAAAKLHSEHTKAEPTFRYAGLTAPMVNPKKAEEVSNSITGQTGGMNRSGIPVIGDLIDGIKSLPDVQRGFHEQPMATAKGLFGGLLEGLTSITDPVSIASFGLPILGKAAKASKLLKPAAAAAEEIGTAAKPAVTAATLAAKAAPAVEQRAATRVAGSAEDAAYSRMREKLATGATTGSPELRKVDEAKRALDVSRETAEKVRLKKPATAPARPVAADNINRLPGTRVVKKNILRPDQSTFDLAQEAMPNGIKLKALKKIPKPTGDDELSRALRQRAHINAADAAKKAKGGGEAGFATTGMMTELPKALLQARSASMLSGMALPMSIAGNVGAPVTAALEAGSMKPIQELLRLPTNTRNVIEAFKTGSNPSEMATYGAKKMGINVPGRVIGAFDTATQQLLQRAGVAPEEAKRLLLQGDNKIAQGLHDIDPHGALFPFQKTPSNFFTEGVKSFTKPGGVGKAAITAGVTGAGYETGKHTDNKTALKTGAALSGVRGVPFLIGAGAGALQRGGSGAARKAMGTFSPVQDMGITSLITNPKEGIKQAVGLKPAFQSAFLDHDDKDGRTRTRTRRRSR